MMRADDGSTTWSSTERQIEQRGGDPGQVAADAGVPLEHRVGGLQRGPLVGVLDLAGLLDVVGDRRERRHDVLEDRQQLDVLAVDVDRPG